MARVYDATDYGNPMSVREGIAAGLLGAGVVAVFYLLFDVIIRKQALWTPTVLGEVLVLQRPIAGEQGVDLTAVALYSVVHIVAFVVFGIVLTLLAARSERSALARYGTIQLLIAFEVFFYGMLAVGLFKTNGAFPLWTILLANSLAALAMCVWLWKRHPAVSAGWREPLGAARQEDVVTSARRA